MATVAQVVERFAAAVGETPATMLLRSRYLRESRLLPQSGKGGGKRASHVEPQHLANLILAMGGAQPSDAPDAVRTLRPMILLHRDVERRNTAQGATSGPYGVFGVRELSPKDIGRMTLGELVEALIQYFAKPGGKITAWRAMGWEMSLSPTIPAAWTTYAWGDERCTDHYEHGNVIPGLLALSNPSRPPALVRRLTTIPSALIEIAAELWADTLANRGDLLTSGQPSPQVKPELEAPDPHHRGPALDSNQSPKGRPGLDTREAMTVRERTQRAIAPLLTGFSQPEVERPRKHGDRTHSSDAAAA